MQRVFLDANVLVSAALTSGSALHELWRRDDLRLLASPYVITEARRNVREPGAASRLEALLDAVVALPSEPADFPIADDPCLPAEDRPVMLGAIVTQADFLLTGDITHFGGCLGRSISGVTVALPGAFLRGRGR